MQASPWILLLYSLPTGRSSARVGLWRKLKKSGALPLKTSAHLLPNRPELVERFEWLSQEIRDAGGESSLLYVAVLGGVSDAEMVAQFMTARETDYADITKQLSEIDRSMKKEPEPALQAQLEKLRRQFVEIQSIDFFDSPRALEVAGLFERVATSKDKRKRSSASILSPSRFRNKIWLTRPRPAIDRVGSAWLIRRFVDPEAKFVFGGDAGAHPDAIPYDMAGVEFGHQGEDCSFETLLKRFDIHEKALNKIAGMIHDADLDDGKFQAVEAFGLDRIFKGWAKLGVSDEEILSRGFECFDALHAFLKSKS